MKVPKWVEKSVTRDFPKIKEEEMKEMNQWLGNEK